MEIIKYPEKSTWDDILKRPAFDTSSLDEKVSVIMNEVKADGDVAVKKYTKMFDGTEIDVLEVSKKELDEAANEIGDDLKKAIDVAIKNITAFHKAQKSEEVRVTTQNGVECWQKPVAIEKVGLYIPGGTAPLFSTVLMLAIPALIAGCKEIILCSPPSKEGKLNAGILYSASKVGVRKI